MPRPTDLTTTLRGLGAYSARLNQFASQAVAHARKALDRALTAAECREVMAGWHAERAAA